MREQHTKYTFSNSYEWKRQKKKRTSKSFSFTLFHSDSLLYIYGVLQCANHAIHTKQLPHQKEESMEKNGTEENSSESCTFFKALPALALYLGTIHFNLILILFATFFLPLSKALLFVFFSSYFLHVSSSICNTCLHSLHHVKGFTLFMLGSLVCSSCSS